MTVLIDTSFLLAVTYEKDSRHLEARQARSNLKAQQVIPLPVLQEFFQLVTARHSYSRALSALKVLHASTSIIEQVTDVDLIRMAEIMEQYSDAELDFADASLMAVSERLNITTIYTFDRRDFGMFRPKHTDFLKLLP